MTQKNFRIIPAHIRQALTALAVDDVVVACVKHLSVVDVAAFGHLGLRIENGMLVIPPPVIPPERQGKYSSANTRGRIRVRRDLPKISKLYTTEAPNWGGHGTHDVDWNRSVYQKELIPPKELTISIQLLEHDSAATGFTVKFSVDQVLNRAAPDFENDLLYNLNILQENVGTAMLMHSTATLEEYLSTVRVSWEILPPGTVEEVLRAILRGKPLVPKEQQDVMRSRLQVMQLLGPQRYIAGTSGFLRYFGAQFAEDFVAFENLQYGNALYVMFENWQVLSQRSRIDLLKGVREGFERIPHREGWAKRLQSTLTHYRENQRRRHG